MNDYDDDRRRSFDRNAQLYDAARPSYPDALVAAILARTGAHRLLELGAGTGKATVVFARRGVSIVALEPGANMAAVLRTNVAAFANVSVVESTFEAWDGADGSYELAYAAQAMHWIDPAVRYVKLARALAPHGWACVIRNEKAAWEPGLRAELDAAYDRAMGPPRGGQAPDSVDGARREYTAELDGSGLFGPVYVEEVAWSQRYTTRAYLDLLATYSDHALLAPEVRTQLFAEVAAALDRRGGVLELPYVALALLAPRRS